jgi:Fe-S-cluster-containing dehydrogenase component
MTRYGMVIDAAHCIGCCTCMVTCKDEFVGNDYLPYSAAQPNADYGYALQPYSSSTFYKPGHTWIKNIEVVKGTFPHVKTQFHSEPCMQCVNPPCKAAATGGAVSVRPDGIVLIDPVKSVGQQQIVSACPYGRIYWNDALNIPQKCTFCAHLLDQGQAPRCVEACPMSVYTFGDLDDPKSAVSQKLAASEAQPLHPEYVTQPKVYYIGLRSTFLSGTVGDGSAAAYVEGATVTLKDPAGQTWTTLTDNYGDFEFGGLKTKVMYTLTISKSKYFTATRLVYVNTDTDIGEMKLVPSGV